VLIKAAQTALMPSTSLLDPPSPRRERHDADRGATPGFWTAPLPHRTRRPAPGRRAADWLAGLAGLGLGITVALAVTAESSRSLAAVGGAATAAGRLTGLVAAYLMLITVLLVARIPALDRAIGHDRLVVWHRRLGPWPLYLVAAHGVLITIGYAEAAKTGVLHEFWTLLMTYPGVLAGTVGFGLLVAAGVTSYRKARRKLRYETWWTVHLYTYLALALAFSHQVATGASFVGHPVAQVWWTAIWVGTAGVALAYRVLMPILRSAYHGLRVVSVQDEGPGVVSIICKGRRLDRLPLHGGQFLQWRFLARGLWSQAHPYSVSALPHPPYLRVTIKDLGDHSAALARLRPGTRIAVEGPYGAFTRHARSRDAVLLAGAGVGTTPLRALLEDLPAHVDVTMLIRASTPADLVLREEIAELVDARGGRLLELVGPRSEVPLDPASLQRLVPDLGRREVYVCGPDGFNDLVRRAAHAAGVRRNQFHVEAFAF
jgi:predicted ferric reductase